MEAIARSRQPLICAGGGVWLADAKEELLELAERCSIPVVKTMMGMGLLPTDHPLNMGMIGAHGNHCANKALAKADLLIMVGTGPPTGPWWTRGDPAPHGHHPHRRGPGGDRKKYAGRHPSGGQCEGHPPADPGPGRGGHRLGGLAGKAA